MKIRNGFVSNSSSSSFLVAFDRKPATVKELQKILFGDKKYIAYYDYVHSTEKAAETVFNDLQKQSPLALNDVADELSYGYVGEDGELDFPHYNPEATPEEHDRSWNEYENKRKQISQRVADEKWKEWKGKEIYRFEYSDNEGEFFCTLEHGDIFSNLPHVQISHH